MYPAQRVRFDLIDCLRELRLDVLGRSPSAETSLGAMKLEMDHGLLYNLERWLEKEFRGAIGFILIYRRSQDAIRSP